MLCIYVKQHSKVPLHWVLSCFTAQACLPYQKYIPSRFSQHEVQTLGLACPLSQSKCEIPEDFYTMTPYDFRFRSPPSRSQAQASFIFETPSSVTSVTANRQNISQSEKGTSDAKPTVANKNSTKTGPVWFLALCADLNYFKWQFSATTCLLGSITIF